MREIKFKYYWQHDDTGRITSKIFTIDDIESGRLKHYVGVNLGSRYSQHIARAEFTGLKDKNGKQIFESDIVKKHNNGIGHIEFGRVLMDCTGSAYSGFFIRKLHGNYTNLDGTLEIIGNIHESPELLEQS